MQVKLLRVLQEGTFEPVGGEHTARVDVRVISATNKSLKELVRKGTFREDLYYRLAVVPIEVPPFRERRNDIALLGDHFLEKFAGRLGKVKMQFSDNVRSIFMSYGWPGNVRQLQNVIQFSLIKCKGQVIEPDHLPPEITASMVLPTQKQQDLSGKAGRKPKLSEETVTVALRRTAGNKAKAARMLGVGRATLYNFLTENPHLAKPQGE
jgi:DNA-binding NtrC family response regulator